MLLDREAANFTPLMAMTVADIRAWPIHSEEFVLDQQRRVAGPRGDPDEVLVRGDCAVDQHHRCRRVPVLVYEPAPEIEQHDRQGLCRRPRPRPAC